MTTDLDNLRGDVNYLWKKIEVLMGSTKELLERNYEQNEILHDIAKEITGIRSRIDTLEKRQHIE